MTDRPSAYHTPQQISGTTIVRPLVVPFDLLTHVSGAITDLADSNAWDEIGVPVSEVIKALTDMIDLYYTPWMVGQVSAFIHATMPPGWISLTTGDNVVVSQAEYPELTAVSPAHWKVSGNLVIPSMDARYLRAVVSFAASPGTYFGDNSKTIAVGNLPPHTHTYLPPTVNPDVEGPGVPDVGATVLGSITNTGSTGSGSALDISPASFLVYFGIFAGRLWTP